VKHLGAWCNEDGEGDLEANTGNSTVENVINMYEKNRAKASQYRTPGTPGQSKHREM
jgi:hypothetical protein